MLRSDPDVLDELYTRYQAAMHATRVMGYFLPHLDSIDLRIAKIRVLADDDWVEGGDSHHAQLRRTWVTMLGREPTMSDKDFGDNFSTCIELAHAEESLSTIEFALRDWPELTSETIDGADEMGKELDLYWEGLATLFCVQTGREYR